MNWTVKTARTLPNNVPIKGVRHVEAPTLTKAINQAATLIDLTSGFSISNNP